VLKARLATAIIAIPILSGIIWIGGPVFVAAVALAAVVAAREAVGLLVERPGPGGAGPAMLTAVALVLAAVGGATMVVAVTGLAVFANAALALLPRREGPPLPPDWAAGLAAGMYAGLPLSILILLRFAPGARVALSWLAPPLPSGVAWILVTFTIVWAVDTVAYGGGRIAGRRLLWPRVSPKKTWEGTAAGFVAGVAVALIWSGPLRVGPLPGLAMGMAVAASAILGDLLESAMKRAAGAKDSGALFPGHGGLLDRLDSLSFALVVVFCIRMVSGT
jgi:phosphatidate cytidylyltransferase